MTPLSRASSPQLTHLEGLNPQQLEAVRHFRGPLLVLAGAGSGKTRVLTARICHLVQEHGVPPHRILAVTFTNKAAGEMRDRIRRFLGDEPRGMWVGTFHALGARILRRHGPLLGWSPNFTIYDQEQSLRQIKRVQEEAEIDPKRWNPKIFRALVSAAKNQLVSAREFLEENEGSPDPGLRHGARVYPAYQESLRSHDAFDFDDLLMKPVELLEGSGEVLEEYRRRFSFLLVDEYQDTNRAQFRFVELLAGAEANLMVVGDDDQSIYAWRGADIRNILDFEAAFPAVRTVRLEQNYRSSETILEAANQVIRQNLRRKEKTLRTDREGGEAVTLGEMLDETDEARWIVDEIRARTEREPGRSLRSFAVLYRTNAQARALEDAFRRAGLPYQVVGGIRFYERREVQDLLAYLRLISNPRDGEAFDRIVNYPRRGIGGTTLARLTGWARSEGMGLLEAASRAGEGPGIPAAGARSLEAFAALIGRYAARAGHLRVGALLQELVEELGLVEHLLEEGPDGEDRSENVRELVAAALDFSAELLEEEDLPPGRFSELDLFLQRVSLVAEVDLHDPEAEAATLMTLHNAKGLEFPIVFISGLEEGLFPLSRSLADPAVLEEERRLFYVGLTRAQDKLFLTHARRRRRAGEIMFGSLSSFAEAIAPELVELRPSPRLRRSFGAPFRTGSSTSSRKSGRGGGRVEGWEDEVFFEEELNQDLPAFGKGERVVHRTFGSGTVLEASGFGPDLKVTVDFDSAGRKKLLARYADLRRDFP